MSEPVSELRESVRGLMAELAMMRSSRWEEDTFLEAVAEYSESFGLEADDLSALLDGIARIHQNQRVGV